MPFTLKLPRMAFRRFALGAVAALGFGSLFFSGCSTDLDPNADYKEITVLYSILNPADKIHYVKVTKAFQNNNADARYIAANIPDSTYYGTEMVVKLQKLKADSSVLAEYPLTRIDTTGKEPGTFFSGSQILYRTNSLTLDENATYRVVATNTRTGNVAQSATELLREGNFCIFQVSTSPTTAFRSCYTETNKSSYDADKKGNAIKYNPPANAYIYSVRIDFNFTETTNGIAQNKQVSWYVRSNTLIAPNTTDPDAPIIFQIDDNSFYSNVLNLINTDNDNASTTRTAGNILTTVTAGTKTLATYYQVNNAFSVFSQTRPEFDNVNNGTGLVASRRQKIAAATLSPDALKKLRQDPALQKLKF
jgi:predicted protein tyrosine phosphatase